jgi:hypothetical protein
MQNMCDGLCGIIEIYTLKEIIMSDAPVIDKDTVAGTATGLANQPIPASILDLVDGAIVRITAIATGSGCKVSRVGDTTGAFAEDVLVNQIVTLGFIEGTWNYKEVENVTFDGDWKFYIEQSSSAQFVRKAR